MKEKFKLTPLERNWVLYDVANSAFILLVTTLIPIYFKSMTQKAGISEADYLSYWSYAASIATLCVAFIAPVCGTMADRKDFKKPIFVICLSVGALGCALFGVMPTWMSFLVLFVIAKVGYTSANVFYDAMLPEITTDERMDRVSTQGYAFGYIGSVIPFVVCLALVLLSQNGVIPLPINTAFVISFLITAIWWVALTVPLLKSYKQTAYVERTEHPIRDTFCQLGRTLRNVSGEKHVFLYLLAFFFFIDGVYTIIDLATAYGESLGLDSTALLLALLLTQIVAFPCSIIFGRLSGKYDTGLLIKVCIAAYCCIAIFAVFLTVEWQFWTLAVLVGMFQGGIQALSRSYLGKIIDPEHSGEYYGLMDICGKGASFTGTMLVGVITQITGHQNIGIGAIAIMFIVGFLIFCKADGLNKSRIKA